MSFETLTSNNTTHTSSYPTGQKRERLKRKAAEVFRQFDIEQKGYIEQSELRAALKRVGFTPDNVLIKEMFETIDIKHDGRIDLEEFQHFCSEAQTADIIELLEFWTQQVHTLDLSAVPGFEKEATSPTFEKLGTMLAGALAGTVAKTATNPLGRLMILQQVEQISFFSPHTLSFLRTSPRQAPLYSNGVLRSLRVMLAQEGWRGLWKGNFTNVIRAAPYAGVSYAVYEAIKKTFAQYTGRSIRDAGVVIELMAGALAGTAAVAVTYPLDLVRTRLSAQTGLAETSRYSGICRTLLLTVQEEGWRGMYRGLGVAMMASAPNFAISWVVYETIKKKLLQRKHPKRRNEHLHEMMSVLTAGAVSGTVACTATYPLDVLRRVMQVQGSGTVYRTSAWQAARHIARTSGWRGFYRGLWAMFVKVVPQVAISFGTYELTKQLLGLERMPPRR